VLAVDGDPGGLPGGVVEREVEVVDVGDPGHAQERLQLRGERRQAQARPRSSAGKFEFFVVRSLPSNVGDVNVSISDFSFQLSSYFAGSRSDYTT
jgi:hypothetical protein